MSGIKIGDETFRNLEDQIGYLTAAFQSGKLIDELGIKVLGVFPTPEQAKTAIPGPYVYGEAFEIGDGIPYNLYIFTRNIEDFFDFGPFPAPGKDGKDGEPGPKGEKGAQGERGERGPQGVQGITGARGPIGPQGPVGPAFNVLGTLSSTSQLPTPTEELRDAGSAYLIPDTEGTKHIWIIEGPQNGNLEWTDIGVAGVGVQGPKGDAGVGINNLLTITDVGTPHVDYNTTDGMSTLTTYRFRYHTTDDYSQDVTHDVETTLETPIVFGQGLTADATEEADKVVVKANIAKIQGDGSTEFVPDENGVVTIPDAGIKTSGLVKVDSNFGLIPITFPSTPKGTIAVAGASDVDIGNRTTVYKPITPYRLNFAVKAALTDDKRMGTETSGTNTAFTDTEKDRACEILGATRTNGFKTLFGNQSIVGSGNIDIYKHNLRITSVTAGLTDIGCQIISSNNLNINSLTDLQTILADDEIVVATGIARIYSDGTRLCIRFTKTTVTTYDDGWTTIDRTWAQLLENSGGLTFSDTVTTI